MRLLLVMGFCGILSSCERRPKVVSESGVKVDSLLLTEDFSLDSLDFNVIRFDTAIHYIFPETSKAVELAEDEIKECEVLLRCYLLEYNAEATRRFNKEVKKYPDGTFDKAEFIIEMKDYGRQYMAVVLEDGTKIVYVNCFCHPGEFDYRDKTLVHVYDGGNCFFNFKVNLNEKKIFDFMVNGVA